MAEKKTIADLKVGDKLGLGRYSVREDTPPALITWIKMTPNCDFIAESVLDYLYFDAAEASGTECSYYGNPDFDLSNIAQFLNTELGPREWFVPKTEADRPPLPVGTWRLQLGYTDRSGFLRYFTECEREAIDGIIRLPHVAEILGNDGDRAQLFKRHGVRAHGSADFVRNKEYSGFDDYKWISYYTMDRNERYIKSISRSGSSQNTFAANGDGIRPVCTLREDTEVRLSESGCGHYEIVEITPKYQVEDINKLFGF